MSTEENYDNTMIVDTKEDGRSAKKSGSSTDLAVHGSTPASKKRKVRPVLALVNHDELKSC